MKGKFLGRLSKLKHRYGLKDNDTLALYHQKWWEVFISQEWPKKLSGKVVEGLVKRWAFFDKSYSVKCEPIAFKPLLIKRSLKLRCNHKTSVNCSKHCSNI